MISEKMKPMMAGSSVIRAMFEEGVKMAAVYGKDNVYDFSLGNPNVPAPDCVKQAILDIINEEDPVMVHGYMPNAGYVDVRTAVADSLNRRFGMDYGPENILMTVGAASGLNDILKTILNPGDQVLTFAPFFVEYSSYVKNYDGELVVVPPDTSTFQPDLEEFEKRINHRTKAVIVNNPNNPTGVVYSEETIRRLLRMVLGCVKILHHIFFLQIVVIISDIVDQSMVFQVQDPGGRPVDKIPVVGDVEHSSRVVDQGVLQDFLGGNVQVVGGLVQDQEVGLGEHKLCQGDPASFSAAQVFDALEHVVAGEQEGGQHVADLGVVHVGVGVLKFVKKSFLHVEYLVFLVVITDVDFRSQTDFS